MANKICSNRRMRNWHYVNCQSPPTVVRDGKDYCHNHDPQKSQVAKAGKNVATMYAVVGKGYGAQTEATSAKKVEDARVKADEENIRHEQEMEVINDMRVLMEVL